MTQQTYPSGPPRPTRPYDALDRLFAAARRLGVPRDGEEKWFGGVAAGLAGRWGVDPLIVRAGFILAAVLFGIGVPLYFVGWALLPDDQDQIVAEKAIRHGDPGSITLCVIAVVLSCGGFGAFWSIGNGWGVGGQAIGLAVLAWAFLAWNGHGPGARRPDESTHAWTSRLSDAVRSNGSTGTAPQHTPREPAPQSAGNRAAAAGAAVRDGGIDLRKRDEGAPWSGASGVPGGQDPWGTVAAPVRVKRRRLGAALTLAILGISVLAGAFTALVLVSTSHGDSALQLGLAAGAAVAAVALVIGGLAGRRGGVLGALATIAALLALATSAAAPKDMPWTGTIGDELWQPTSVTQHNFAMRVGDGRLDLSGLHAADLPQHTNLHARVNVGQLTITVPDGVTVKVHGYAHIGQIEVVHRGTTDKHISGHGGIDTRHTFTVGSGPKVIDLDASVGMGNITIKETS
ncbi:PspC domain-containing protein [Flexivirga oryzae]|uniref:Phage shock protein PspC (Stress-responsive transcriptional regulator) n=1 Tax=Flexivirga oryzae TaxID=1794944 RepID=A0A839N5P0_9MICO|nr:PspC domain-containing protein [Flexivirga oryzae]MBB2892597.1 phage shock protein PspC (stress-responsive transcriptional regulator) [Flexivirga oryzae]